MKYVILYAFYVNLKRPYVFFAARVNVDKRGKLI